MKKTIRLNESQLNEIVHKAVSKILESDNQDKDYLAISFANKYYTLWHISDTVKEIDAHCKMRFINYDYIKNVSFDKETAFAKYPDAVWDPSLQGKTRSWTSQKEVIWDDADTFRFGQYKGRKIESVSDNSYIEWYYGQVYDDEHRKCIEDVMKDRGYAVKEMSCNNRRLVSPYEQEIKRKSREEREALIRKLDNVEPLEVFIDHNPDEEGWYMGEGNILYKFQDVKEGYYSGYTYYIPMLNGKGKRVKNKYILIKDYTWRYDEDEKGRIIVDILDFDVLKN